MFQIAPVMAQISKLLPAGNRRQKQLLLGFLVGGGLIGARQLLHVVREAQREQKELSAASASKSSSHKAPKVAVNKLFLKRLQLCLKICVPSLVSKEAFLILVQGVLLVSRTLLTEYISQIEGYCGSSLVSQQFTKFLRGVMGFAIVGIPTAIVNSGLKYMQKQLQLSFQARLTTYLHGEYCSNRAYYAASTLGGLTHADQRITEDVEKFAFSISELYSHTFKPLLDVILFTRSLSKVMGYKGQFGLYLYYLLVAYLLRIISPPLAQMTAQETALTGTLRGAHQRLVVHAEEVAFNDPPSGVAEELILNQHLRRLVRYSSLSALQRFLQHIADGYFIKYFASVVSLLVYAAPIYFKDPSTRGTQGELTKDYIRSMRLLQNTSKGVGDLILVYKRVGNLAGHTSRVAELLEQVKMLSSDDAEHKELFRKNVSSTHLLAVVDAEGLELLPPRRLVSDNIEFRRVALDSPDGQPLIRELSFTVSPGKSVILMGPNGCGKSSLFRVLAGLWPLQAGEISCPTQSHLFYLAQRPYLVAGTLRDQIMYPYPPRDVWNKATPQERALFQSVSGHEPPSGSDVDARLGECLAAVELDYLLLRGKGWDQVQSWQDTLSGGERQRLAMARLLYHRPTYAVLDECTSAVSADGEIKLYEACIHAGITLLSIAHRPALKKYHSTVVYVDGSVNRTGRGWKIEEVAENVSSEGNRPS